MNNRISVHRRLLHERQHGIARTHLAFVGVDTRATHFQSHSQACAQHEELHFFVSLALCALCLGRKIRVNDRLQK